MSTLEISDSDFRSIEYESKCTKGVGFLIFYCDLTSTKSGCLKWVFKNSSNSEKVCFDYLSRSLIKNLTEREMLSLSSKGNTAPILTKFSNWNSYD